MPFQKSDKSFFEKEREELEKLEKKGGRKFLKFYDFGTSTLRAEIKRKPAQYFFLFITSFLGSVITSAVALFGFSSNIIAQFSAPKMPERAVAAVQATPTPSVVTTAKYDHLLLASKLKKGEKDLEIIDIRTKKEFDKGHIVTAVNIPVYESEIVTDEGDLDTKAVFEAFDEYMKTDTILIIYAQNAYSTLPSDIAKLLNSGSKTVKALAVGFEEWEHLNSR